MNSAMTRAKIHEICPMGPYMSVAGLSWRLTRPALLCLAVERSISRSSSARDSPPAIGDSVVPYASLATPALRKYLPYASSSSLGENKQPGTTHAQSIMLRLSVSALNGIECLCL